jgi:hypothetical protein
LRNGAGGAAGGAGRDGPVVRVRQEAPGAQADLRHGRLFVSGKHLGRCITEALTDYELDEIDDGRTGAWTCCSAATGGGLNE